MAIYIEYEYPAKQPRVLIIPDNNTINPNVQYMNQHGLVRDMQWQHGMNIMTKINYLVEQFVQ